MAARKEKADYRARLTLAEYAADLRMMGYTYMDIADRIGVDKAFVNCLFKTLKQKNYDKYYTCIYICREYRQELRLYRETVITKNISSIRQLKKSFHTLDLLKSTEQNLKEYNIKMYSAYMSRKYNWP